MKKNKRQSTTTGTSAKLRKKDIAISLVALMSLLIATVLNASISLSSQSLIISPSPLPTASAQMSAEDERTNSLLSSYSTSALTTSSSSSSSSLSTSTSTSTSASHEFRIAYSKLGVSSGSYQRILYDSETNSLRLTNISTAINDNESGRLSMSQGQSQSQSNKQVSDLDQNNLQRMIDKNGFFQTNGIYPPPATGANENYDTLYVLTIEMDNRHHTVVWTDNSENIPTVLQSIVKAIEKISSA